MRLTRLFLVLLAALALGGCAPAEQGLFTLTVVVGESHSIESGNALRGAVYVLDGELAIRRGAALAGPLYILGGAVTVEGEVAGDISLLGGDLVLRPGARVGGTLSQAGGGLAQAPGATIAGGIDTGTGLEVPRQPAAFGGQLAGPLIQALVVAALAYLLARYLPGPLARVTGVIQEHPVVAGAMGLLAGVIALVLLVLIAFTIILLPLSFLGGFALLVAVVYGWAGFGLAVGRLLVRCLGLRLRPATAAFFGTLLFMAIFELMRLIPLIASIVPLLLMAVGFGAVMLTRFGARRFVPAADEAPELMPAEDQS